MCFITGAASGIGRAVAEQSAQAGAHVLLTDINEDALSTVAEGIRTAGGVVLDSRALDIADIEQVQSYARDIHERFGSVDVLMNVAGISIWGTVDTLSHEQWRRVVDINLMGPIHVIESFVPQMIEAQRGGHIVNVSSAAGLFGLPWHAAYSASKFGLRGVSEVLRFDLERHGIGVSLVCPGGVDTGLVQTLEVAGIDMQQPHMQKLKAHFQRHAVSPDTAARAIIKGVTAGRYMVFTSNDIRLGYWFQRKFSWPYELVMRWLNQRLYKLSIDARRAAVDV
ncbi:short chain dehydrogenase [Oceanococcus atlanticus]|uniref:Short chain dehydrogenase n=1 Tax=Oceanococcus atlanticus TaxID=1317117 RepID=A0A1Y1SDU9_9GAMM|nr:short chain dehydrogenase [Oceanococcus atlanticus]